MAHTSGACVADGTYEPDLTRCIKNNLHEGATAIDIGANVGYYARLFARTVKAAGKVIAFEAESENYRCLCKNIENFNNVTPVALAVSDKNAIADIYRSSHSSCHSLLGTGNYQNKSSFRVATIKLDLFWELYMDETDIDCIKVDVEGAEILVLDGMHNMLDRNAVKMMIIELCPAIMMNSGFDPTHLFERIAPAFEVRVVESEYQEIIDSGLISNEKQFNTLQNHLMESGDFINCNLFCKRLP